MDDMLVVKSSNDAAPDGKCRGDGVLVRSPLKGSLKDITNLQQNHRMSNPDDKYKLISSFSENDQIDQILKEKMALMKQISERNKIIELTGMELQKLRVNLQEVQQQNWHLARTNSQMLVELNASKDKLLVLQHELGCVRSQLAVKNLELQMKKKEIKKQKAAAGAQKTECEEPGEQSQSDVNENKLHSCNGRRPSRVAVTSISKGIHANEKYQNKRFSLRRKSCTFKTDEMEATEKIAKDVECVLNKGKSENRRVSHRRRSSMFDTEEMESTKDSLKADKVILTQEKSENGRSNADDMESREDILEKDVARLPESSQFNDEKHDGDLIPSAYSVAEADLGKVNTDVSLVQESAVNAFEMDDAKFHPCPQLHDQNNYESKTAEGYSNGSATRNIRRSSLGRPLRRAAERVQSYREASLNRKIRRLD